MEYIQAKMMNQSLEKQSHLQCRGRGGGWGIQLLLSQNETQNPHSHGNPMYSEPAIKALLYQTVSSRGKKDLKNTQNKCIFQQIHVFLHPHTGLTLLLMSTEYNICFRWGPVYSFSLNEISWRRVLWRWRGEEPPFLIYRGQSDWPEMGSNRKFAVKSQW